MINSLNINLIFLKQFNDFEQFKDHLKSQKKLVSIKLY